MKITYALNYTDLKSYENSIHVRFLFWLVLQIL